MTDEREDSSVANRREWYIEVAKNFDRKARETNIRSNRVLWRHISFDARKTAREMEVV